MNKNSKPSEITEEAKEFLAKPSKLSTGKNNLRFQGSIRSNSIGQEQTNQSSGYQRK